MLELTGTAEVPKPRAFALCPAAPVSQPSMHGSLNAMRSLGVWFERLHPPPLHRHLRERDVPVAARLL